MRRGDKKGEDGVDKKGEDAVTRKEKMERQERRRCGDKKEKKG
jgi:hypothetical protein